MQKPKRAIRMTDRFFFHIRQKLKALVEATSAQRVFVKYMLNIRSPVHLYCKQKKSTKERKQQINVFKFELYVIIYHRL